MHIFENDMHHFALKKQVLITTILQKQLAAQTCYMGKQLRWRLGHKIEYPKLNLVIKLLAFMHSKLLAMFT